jgi:hypothetical protein
MSMAQIVAPLRFLEKLPLYKHVQPFVAVPSSEVGFDPEKHTNMRLKEYSVKIADIRDNIDHYKLDECGFEIVSHRSSNLSFQNQNDIEAYQQETAAWLKKRFNAEHVECWDFKVSVSEAFHKDLYKLFYIQIRKNQEFTTGSYDILDPLQYDQPARCR